MNDEQRKKLANEAADQIRSAHLEPIRDAVASAIDEAIEDALQPYEKSAALKAADRILSAHLDPVRDAIADAIDGAIAEALDAAVDTAIDTAVDTAVGQAALQNIDKGAAREVLKQIRETIGGWGTMPDPSMGSANGAFFKEAVLRLLDEKIEELE